MRQAVVIIHGIGDQRPMKTLRSFVAGVLGVGEMELKDGAFSKPDRISDILELRRLSVLPGSYDEKPGRCGVKLVLKKDCETDFYELYWQHLMEGARWRPVLGWLLRRLGGLERLNEGEREKRIRKQLVAVAVAAVTIVVAAIVLINAWLVPYVGRIGLVILVPLMLLAWWLFDKLELGVLKYLGDAARYLSPDPSNIAVRRAIRTAGLTLLRGLHEDPLRRYQRIVLVGHSLGSVIAYDLITWFWQEQHHRVESKGKTLLTRPSKTGAEGLDKSPLKEFCDSADIRAVQWKLWKEHRAQRLPWLITDLVTLGSPLAYSRLLLADGKGDLEIGKCQREFPTCPPAQEDGRDCGRLWHEYGDATRPQSLRILHHGAPFAVTRWTNLHFQGDIVGGPVAPLFGKGIKDVELKCGRTAKLWRSHLHYWNIQEKEACQELRAALSLNEG